eukprot:3959408-Heterocapsa_arctica.AAC.2
MTNIVKLNKVCGHNHPYRQCHGVSATASSYYTPAFVAEVGRMLLEKIDEHDTGAVDGVGGHIATTKSQEEEEEWCGSGNRKPQGREWPRSG